MEASTPQIIIPMISPPAFGRLFRPRRLNGSLSLPYKRQFHPRGGLHSSIAAVEFAPSHTMASDESYQTVILPVDTKKLGQIVPKDGFKSFLDDWDIILGKSESAWNLEYAASLVRSSDIPVGFPTETVYGLGADATRSSAVRGIFKAKNRPSDNPLIVHFASLNQLRQLLTLHPSDSSASSSHDPIPSIYRPLIEKFWPGPLTILLPNPSNSPLAPEVTAGLNSFGARIPRNLLALALIKVAGVPIAAPSANASTKPSPTAAEHVKDDLDGRIECILDGGPCDVGVESTVVDGHSCPPAILRPGGISIEQLRECKGWENVTIGYKDEAQETGAAPRAPGMKYRHYSPSAKVILYEAGSAPPTWGDVTHLSGKPLGFIRCKTWLKSCEIFAQENDSNGIHAPPAVNGANATSSDHPNGNKPPESVFWTLPTSLVYSVPLAVRRDIADAQSSQRKITVWTVDLGSVTENIGRGLFSALRELDRKQVGAIFVEGIDENEGDVAAAVMNRLRKAAEINVR